jgi:hypothetical protein
VRVLWSTGTSFKNPELLCIGMSLWAPLCLTRGRQLTRPPPATLVSAAGRKPAVEVPASVVQNDTRSLSKRTGRYTGPAWAEAGKEQLRLRIRLYDRWGRIVSSGGCTFFRGNGNRRTCGDLAGLTRSPSVHHPVTGYFEHQPRFSTASVSSGCRARRELGRA